jgi:alpha-L-fucosidase
MQRYKEFGAEIRGRLGQSAAETAGKGNVVELALERPAYIDHVVIMEQITEGARVREYMVEARSNGQWKELCNGTSIGHKKIDRFPSVEVSQLRLIVTKAAAEPLIRAVAAYHTCGTRHGE